MVLKAGYAYEQAMNWRGRHPHLMIEADHPAAFSMENERSIPASGMDAKARGLVLGTAQNAGLRLDERQISILLESAPHAIAMAKRIRKQRDVMEEPSLIFRVSE